LYRHNSFLDYEVSPFFFPPGGGVSTAPFQVRIQVMDPVALFISWNLFWLIALPISTVIVFSMMGVELSSNHAIIAPPIWPARHAWQ
jgi:hypothetical protein